VIIASAFGRISCKRVSLTKRYVVGSICAGTTAAGLRFGLPTLVCPFFGDQFMWGFFVEMAGVGPKACPVTKLTVDLLAEKLEMLASEKTQRKATALAEEMKCEDGIQGGHDHFVDSLWEENMLCDVSLLLGEVQKARYQVSGFRMPINGVKVSSEVAALVDTEVHSGYKLFRNAIPSFSRIHRDRLWFNSGFRRHAVTSYNLAGRVHTVGEGLFAAVFGLIYNVGAAVFQPVTVPDRWARKYGMCGCLFGIIGAILYMVHFLLVALLVFVDRLLLAITNGVCNAELDFVIDARVKTEVHTTKVIESEFEHYKTQGVPKARRRELSLALGHVLAARRIFQKARPRYPDEHQHFVVVRLPELLAQLDTKNAAAQLDLTDTDRDTVKHALEKLADIPSRAYRIAAREGKRIEGLQKSQRFVSDADLQMLSDIEEEGNSFEILKVMRSSYQKKMKDLLKKSTAQKWEAKPEETDVSFSRFVQALQPVFTVDQRSADGVSHRASLILEQFTSGMRLEEYLR